MKGLKMKYTVLQGVISNSGKGDLHVMGEFDTINEATVFFNDIKADKRGYSLNVYSHLETWLLEDDNWDEPISFWSLQL